MMSVEFLLDMKIWKGKCEQVIEWMWKLNEEQRDLDEFDDPTEEERCRLHKRLLQVGVQREGVAHVHVQRVRHVQALFTHPRTHTYKCLHIDAAVITSDYDWRSI